MLKIRSIHFTARKQEQSRGLHIKTIFPDIWNPLNDETGILASLLKDNPSIIWYKS